MNIHFKRLLCLALVLSGNLIVTPQMACAGETPSSTNDDQTLESLVAADFPGKHPGDLIYGGVWNKKNLRLSPAEVNRIAVAAACRLSLQTTNGDRLTADFVDRIRYQPPSRDTPAQSALRDVCGWDDELMMLLQDMENSQVISDPRVIGPLIDMLDYPGTKTVVREQAAQFLCELTKRGYPVRAQLYEYVNGETNPIRGPYIKWWHDWWAKNKNRHPVFDDDLKKIVTDRITAIRNQIYLEVPGYGGMQYGGSMFGGPVRTLDRDDIMDVGVDSTLTQAYVPAQSRIYLLISAHFETPPFQLNPVKQPSYAPGIVGTWRPWNLTNGIPIEEVCRQEVPGTDIAIAVDVASEDGKLPQLVRECLQRPPGSIQPEIARLTAQLGDEEKSRLAASGLVRVGVYAPVIAALSSTNLTIQRNAITALNEAWNIPDKSKIEGAVPPLIHLLQTSDPYTQYLAAWVLGKIHLQPELSVPALMTASDNTNDQAAITALRSLREFQSQENIIVPFLIQKLSSPRSAIRSEAVGTLCGSWGFPNDQLPVIVSAVCQATQDPAAEVRRLAVTVLAGIISQKLNPYGTYWSDSSPAETNAYLTAQAPTIIAALIQSLSDTNAPVRAAAASALGGLGRFDKTENSKIIRALISAMADKDENVRARAIFAAGNFGADATNAIPVLVGLTNASFGFNERASESLGHIRADIYQEKLNQLLQEKFPRLEQAAAPIQKMKTTHWIVETNLLPGIQGPPLLVKRADYRMKVIMGQAIVPTTIDFVAFKTPQGKIWIGWDMDFYVETASAIIGGMLTPYGTVYWHENSADPSRSDLDDAIRQFEERVEESKIKGEYTSQSNLNEVRAYGIFYISGSDVSVMPKFLGVDAHGDIARLDLENPETGDAASFWINLQTKKIVKAFEKKL